MVSSVQNSINSVIFSASGANTLSASASTNLLQSAFTPSIPEDLSVTMSNGQSMDLSTLLATNLASNNDYNIFSSLSGSSSTSNLLASSYNSSSSLNSVLSSNFGTQGTGLDLLV